MMINTENNWWETIFTGSLALGINKERLTELEKENFLYFEENEGIVEQEQTQ